MKQEKVYFISEGLRLSGYFLTSEDGKNLPAVLFLHGSGKIDSHKGYLAWQEYLLANGLASFFFDFRGCGNSEGKFEDGCLNNRLKDAQVALEFLRNHPSINPKRIGLIGGSMGGHIAIRLIERNTSIKSLILVSAAAYSEEAEHLPLNSEFTAAIRRNNNWKPSPVFKILSQVNQLTMLIYSENDSVIPLGLQNTFQRIIEKKHKSEIFQMEKGKHDLLNPLNEEDYEVMLILFDHSTQFLINSL